MVVVDGGDFGSYAGKFIDSETPGSFLDPGPYGCLGTGPGYRLAARAAGQPDRQVFIMLGGVPALVNVLTDPADIYPRSSALL